MVDETKRTLIHETSRLVQDRKAGRRIAAKDSAAHVSDSRDVAVRADAGGGDGIGDKSSTRTRTHKCALMVHR
jgi:hypothetical protein